MNKAILYDTSYGGFANRRNRVSGFQIPVFSVADYKSATTEKGHLKRLPMRKNKIIFLFLCVFCNSSYLCCAQDTLSKITRYGDKDCYAKCIDKEFHKMNRKYGIVSHGVYIVYDLVDTNNKMISEQDTLFLVDNHIYHIVSPWMCEKISMIVIPYNGEMNAFLGLNCCRYIHNVEDVVHWLKNSNQNINDILIDRIRNYYIYHPTLVLDPQGSIPQCESECKNDSLFKLQDINHFTPPKKICRKCKSS